MKVGNYEQMMSHLKDPFNPSELRARVKELEPREDFAIGGGIIQGENLGTREGLANPKIIKLQNPKSDTETHSVRLWDTKNQKNMTVKGTEEELKEFIKPGGDYDKSLSNLKISQKSYDNLYDKYLERIELDMKNKNMLKTPSWMAFINEQGGPKNPTSLQKFETKERPYPAKEGYKNLLNKKKMELAEQLIIEENNKIDGVFLESHKKGGLSKIFRGKLIPETAKVGVQASKDSFELTSELSKLAKKMVDSRTVKIKRALEVITHPDYELKNPIPEEIRKLMGSTIGTKMIREEMYELPEYKKYNYVDKAGKKQNKLSYISKLVSTEASKEKLSFGYLLELADNKQKNVTSFLDTKLTYGKLPYQFIAREANRVYLNTRGQGPISFYKLDKKGNPIKLKYGDARPGQGLDILMRYDDPEFPQYDKYYSFTEITNNPKNLKIGNLKLIDNLPEFSEVKNIVEASNKLNATEMKDPFTGKMSTYAEVAPKILSKIKTRARPEGYSERATKTMTNHIEHERGVSKSIFNNFRLSTGAQNVFFSELNKAASINEELRPYVQGLEQEVSPKFSNFDDQIKYIVKSTGSLGNSLSKIDSKNKVLVPTAMEDAAFNFLKTSKDLPDSVVSYLEKQSSGIKELYKDNPELAKAANKRYEIMSKIYEYENGKGMLAKELSEFCNTQKLNLGTGSLACTPDEITRNMKKAATTEAGKARVLGAARAAGKVFGTIVAPVDIAIETALMAPHLLRGDVQGAIAASTAGFFGAGRDEIEEAEKEYGKDSPLYNLYQRDKAIGDMAMHINKMDRLSGSLKKLIPSEDEITNFSTVDDPRARVSKESYTEQVLKDFIEEAKNKPKIQESFNLHAPKINTPALQFEALDQAYKLSDKIQSSGYYKPDEKGQYPLLQRLESAGIKDLQKTFTKKDIEDRYVDMPLDKTGTDRTFPFTASELAEREKSQMPSEEEIEKRFRRNLGIADPKLVEQYEQMGFPQLTPFLGYADGGRINLSNGGRLTFSDGSPKDPSKRKFLQKTAIGGGVAGGLATGLINLLDLFRGGSKVTKTTEAVQRASRAEEIFFDLVKNVKNKGVMREARFTGDEPGGVIYEHAGVKVIDDEPYTRVEFQTDKGAPAVIEYRKPGYDVDPDTKTTIKDPGGFEYEGQEVGRIRPNGDVDIDFEEEIIDEITNVEKIAKGE